jgi:uncharacterized protein (TIGR03086 family)
MGILENYRRTLDTFDRVVADVPDDRWDITSACTEWTNRDVLGHVTWGQDQVRHLAAGAPFTSRAGAAGAPEPGVLVRGADPARIWRGARDANVAALTPDVLTHVVEPAGFGAVPLAVFVEAMTLDTLAHTWDIGSRVGVPVRFDSDLVEAVLGFALAGLSDPRARAGFADPVEPAPGADGQGRLLAFLGRETEGTTASRG